MRGKAKRAVDAVWKDDSLMGLTVTLKSKTGRSFREKGLRVSRNNFKHFVSDEQKRREARRAFEKEGFRIVAESAVGLSIVGQKRLIEKFFSSKTDVNTIRLKHGKRVVKIREPKATLKIPKGLQQTVDRVRFEQYAIPLESGTPPAVGYYHLNVPDDIADILNASEMHDCGYDGSGIKLCMIDDGFFNHAYYTERGYDITLVPVGTDTMPEGKGHGTAIASNALAVAPGVEFVFVNNMIWIFAIATAAFRAAKDETPDIITCSWGLNSYDADLAWEIVDAVNNGTVVTFACGNGGPVHFPGCMDEVVSVGGVYPAEDGSFHASTYASSGECADNPGRQCPDVCGLVGDAPHGVLIMMPTVPDGTYDNDFAGDDDTATDDGWLCASGTSSAAPQVAGVAALMLQCSPGLTPEDVKSALETSATDITAGASASGEAAGAGVDLATGHGLVDAADAVNAAGCSCGCSFIEVCTIASEVVACLRMVEVCSRFEVCPIRLEAVGCFRPLETGCRLQYMTDPGGCGPTSLIADYFDWRKWAERVPVERPVIVERLRRMTQPPERGTHVRRLTSKSRATAKRPGRGTPARPRTKRPR